MYLDLKKQSNQKRVKTATKKKKPLFFKEANFASEFSPYPQHFIKDGYCDLT